MNEKTVISKLSINCPLAVGPHRKKPCPPLYTSGLSIPAMARFFNQRTRQQYVQHSPKINFPALNAEGRRDLSSGGPPGVFFPAGQIPDL